MGRGKNLLNIIITFRVFGVIPSYLVIIYHIKCVFGKNEFFDEKVFFSTKNLRFGFKNTTYLYIIDNIENIICLCPNHHSQFDVFGFYIDGDTFEIKGLKGYEGKKITIKKKPTG